MSPRALIRPRSSALSPPLPAGSPDALKKSVVISVPDRVGVEDVLRNARGDVEIEIGGEHGEGFERAGKAFQHFVAAAQPDQAHTCATGMVSASRRPQMRIFSGLAIRWPGVRLSI